MMWSQWVWVMKRSAIIGPLLDVLAHELLAEGPDARARVDDDEAGAAAHLEAGGVAAEEGGIGPGVGIEPRSPQIVTVNMRSASELQEDFGLLDLGVDRLLELLEHGLLDARAGRRSRARPCRDNGCPRSRCPRGWRRIGHGHGPEHVAELPGVGLEVVVPADRVRDGPVSFQFCATTPPASQWSMPSDPRSAATSEMRSMSARDMVGTYSSARAF